MRLPGSIIVSSCKWSMRRLVLNALCGSLLLVTSSAAAQTATSPATRRPDPIQGELQRRFEAEAIEKVLARRPQGANAHEHRILLDQIRKDFLRIQVIDHELKKERVGPNEPDLKVVSGYVAEIKRRSERLKDDLSLPKVDTASGS